MNKPDELSSDIRPRQAPIDEMSKFARFAMLVGTTLAVRWGDCLVTIGAVGWRDGERFVMGTFSDGTVVLGAVDDFTEIIGPANRRMSNDPKDLE